MSKPFYHYVFVDELRSGVSEKPPTPLDLEAVQRKILVVYMLTEKGVFVMLDNGNAWMPVLEVQRLTACAGEYSWPA